MLNLFLSVTPPQARNQDLTRGVEYDTPQAKKFFGGIFNDFLNNVWFGFTVVYGCFYSIVNAHYKV